MTNDPKNRAPDPVLRIYDESCTPDAETDHLREVKALLDTLPRERPDPLVLDRIEAAASVAVRVRVQRDPVVLRIGRTPVFRYALAACVLLVVLIAFWMRTPEAFMPMTQAPASDDLPAWDQHEDLYTITRRLNELQQQYDEQGWDEPAVPLESFGAGSIPQDQRPIGFQR